MCLCKGMTQVCANRKVQVGLWHPGHTPAAVGGEMSGMCPDASNTLSLSSSNGIIVASSFLTSRVRGEQLSREREMAA